MGLKSNVYVMKAGKWPSEKGYKDLYDHVYIEREMNLLFLKKCPIAIKKHYKQNTL